MLFTIVTVLIINFIVVVVSVFVVDHDRFAMDSRCEQFHGL